MGTSEAQPVRIAVHTSYLYTPLKLYWAFVAFSVACLLFGPIGFEDVKVSGLLAFLASFLILFSIGYHTSASRAPKRDDAAFSPPPLRGRYHLLLSTLLAWALVSAALSWVTAIREGGQIGLAALGENYVESYRGYIRGSATIDLAYILTFLDESLVTLCVVLGVGGFAQLSRPKRSAVVAVLATYVVVDLLFTGKQKFFGDAVIFTGAAILINLAAERKRLRARTLAAAASAAVVVFAIFTEILRQRYTALGVDLSNAADRVHPLMIFNADSPLVTLLGPGYGLGLGFFLSYFSNGLYGLSLALQLPFEWSWMAGNSYSVGRIVEILIDKPQAILGATYPYRVGEEFGWGFDKWHSAFAWIASDLSFPGLLMLSPFAGAFYARVWKESISASNAFARPLFVYLSLGLVFSLANNQMVHNLAGVITLSALLTMWAAGGIASSPTAQ